MRIPRSIQLWPAKGYVHKFWQCHNKEYLLENHQIKHLYLESTKYALNHKSLNNNIRLSSFCIMSNHTHMHLTYEGSSEFLSQFMRISHARFGYFFNKRVGRSGKVANERPKTPLIEDCSHSMRVHFYIEANPVRAGIVSLKNLRFSKFSSYGFYAYGRTSEWSALLSIPDWYMDLGKTFNQRQIKYRKLFREYLFEGSFQQHFFKPFVGSIIWIDKMEKHSKAMVGLRERASPDG